MEQHDKEKPADFTCYDCKEIAKFKRSCLNKFGFDRIDKKKLNKMLLIVIEMLYKDKDFEDWSDDFFRLDVKAEEDGYDVSAEFLRDCKQLHHQWKILHKEAPDLKQNVQEQLDDLEQCVDCFERYYDCVPWVKAVCSRPHLLVWARTNNKVLYSKLEDDIIFEFTLLFSSQDPYWPAKVLSVRDNELTYVTFFGIQESAQIKAEHIWLFSGSNDSSAYNLHSPAGNRKSRESPSSDKKTRKLTKLFKTAMKDADDYINSVKKTYRFDFKYAAFEQKFDPLNLLSQTEDMFPGYIRPALSNAKDETSAPATSQLQSKNRQVAVKSFPNSIKQQEVKTASSDVTSQVKHGEDKGIECSATIEITPATSFNVSPTRNPVDEASPGCSIPVLDGSSKAEKALPEKPQKGTKRRSTSPLLKDETSLETSAQSKNRKVAVKSFPNPIKQQEVETEHDNNHVASSDEENQHGQGKGIECSSTIKIAPATSFNVSSTRNPLDEASPDSSTPVLDGGSSKAEKASKRTPRKGTKRKSTSRQPPLKEKKKKVVKTFPKPYSHQEAAAAMIGSVVQQPSKSGSPEPKSPLAEDKSSQSVLSDDNANNQALIDLKDANMKLRADREADREADRRAVYDTVMGELDDALEADAQNQIVFQVLNAENLKLEADKEALIKLQAENVMELEALRARCKEHAREIIGLNTLHQARIVTVRQDYKRMHQEMSFLKILITKLSYHM